MLKQVRAWYNGETSIPTPIVATSRQHLRQLLQTAWAADRFGCNLNHIDVSGIHDFSYLFLNMGFNGNVSRWDVSGGVNFEGMFENTPFTGDLSEWNVSNARNMRSMFRNSHFNGDISKWNVSKVGYISRIFEFSKFARDISMWELPPDLNSKELKNVYNENPHFLAAQSVSPLFIKLHLANATQPSDSELVAAFEQVRPLAQGLGLTLSEHAQAIFEMHTNTQGYTHIESIGGPLFESVV